MNIKTTFLSLLTVLSAFQAASAIPSEINYQGRLTDSGGAPASGTKSFAVKLYDAATDGNELYAEDIGSVVVDDNGIYSFQFGASGQSIVDGSDTIATADGSSTSYMGSLTGTPLSDTLSVTDGTYSWNIVDGNPGELATATVQLVNGFVVGFSVANGGEGYTSAPAVTIEGDGTGATATTELTDGAVTAINVGNPGSGYSAATVTIAEPPAPFVVDYSSGEVTVIYESAPSAGTEITASYDANDTSIVGALRSADAHWLELSIDAVQQSPRERILSVPFAQVAGSLETGIPVLGVPLPINVSNDSSFSTEVYRAPTDGFILASNGDSRRTCTIHIGPTSTSLSVISSVDNYNGKGAAMAPVPAGYYWKTRQFRTVFFVPFAP